MMAASTAFAGGPLDKKIAKKVTKRIVADGEAKTALQQAVDFFIDEQYQEAFDIFCKELKNADHKGYAATYIGAIMIEADELDKAADYLKQAEAALPAHDTAFVAYYHGEAARLAEAQKDSEGALAHLAKATEIAPSEGFYYLSRGRLLQKLERYDEAVADFRKGAALEPDDMNAQISLASAIDAQNNFDEALSIFDQVVAQWPSEANAYAYRASTLYNMQQYAKATDDALQALEIDGENSHALWLLPFLKQQDAQMVADKLAAKRSTNPAKWDQVAATLQ